MVPRLYMCRSIISLSKITHEMWGDHPSHEMWGDHPSVKETRQQKEHWG